MIEKPLVSHRPGRSILFLRPQHPSEFGPIIIDVIDLKEQWFSLPTTRTAIAAIRHKNGVLDCRLFDEEFVSHAIPVPAHLMPGSAFLASPD